MGGLTLLSVAVLLTALPHQTMADEHSHQVRIPQCITRITVHTAHNYYLNRPTDNTVAVKMLVTETRLHMTTALRPADCTAVCLSVI